MVQKYSFGKVVLTGLKYHLRSSQYTVTILHKYHQRHQKLLAFVLLSFIDIVVGAPYENDMEGAIYIYNGCKAGIFTEYSQRIPGSTVFPGIKSFGAALSKSYSMNDDNMNGMHNDIKNISCIHLNLQLAIDILSRLTKTCLLYWQMLLCVRAASNLGRFQQNFVCK